jgi:MEMO1 family protein
MEDSIRKQFLSGTWYPAEADEVFSTIKEWERTFSDPGQNAISCIVPHAGWAYSGRLAWSGVRRLAIAGDETVVVIGGHLPQHGGVLYAPEKFYSTPFGKLLADLELIKALQIEMKEVGIPVDLDKGRDNTVEVQLPLIHYRSSRVKAACLRVASGPQAIALGSFLHSYAVKAEKKIIVIGSTDLTHYGPAFHFTPLGAANIAYERVKDEYDAKIIDAFKNMDSDRALKLANNDRSACSVGAAVAAIEFAKGWNCEKGEVIAYGNSYSLSPGTSFVGYASLIYEA